MDIVSTESIIKIFGLCASLATLFYKIKELNFSSRSNVREEYELAEKLLVDDKWKDMHDYQLEKGYMAIGGKPLKASEIRLILKLKNPLSKFKLFEKAERYLTDATDENGVNTICFKNEFSKRKLNLMDRWNFVWYLITAISSGIPLIFVGDIIRECGMIILWGLIPWSTLFAYIAYSYLKEHWRLSTAKYIVEQYWHENKPTSTKHQYY
ncbi:hypothetical protein [Aeromonas jandaei]|uniref:hypothetical protein n=1 Tax=Aeromonas jandaei TaxID=650 RepID=UPI003EC6B186